MFEMPDDRSFLQPGKRCDFLCRKTMLLDSHADRPEKVLVRSHDETTIAVILARNLWSNIGRSGTGQRRWSQFSDCTRTLPNHRNGVKNIFLFS